ncbi:MAG: PCRF domain-containing protein, partial [Peptostreptococcaceae bacterium]
MLQKLAVLEDKYKDLTDKISDPEIINDQKVWQKFMKEHSDLEPIIMKFREYQSVLNSIKDSKEILQEESDEELRELAKMELSEMEVLVDPLEAEIKILLLPKDPNDDKNVIVEVRGGAGGDEAALFAGSLFRMYSRYAERRRWKMELLSASDTGVGGYKEVSFLIKGKGAYSRLKYESGVHRVQRIPATESGGRIHTSTATVAVLPEVETVEVNINPNDLRIDVFRSSGNGGQSV